ncbi:MAG: PqqD family protein [Clostridia bacterium]|nr:PqqD family protein [Clostridia bacterium]
MQIKSGFIVRQVGSRFVAAPTGERAKEIEGMVALSETGAFLWKIMVNPCTEEDLVKALTGEYDVTPEKAAEDVRRFVDYLTKEHILMP